MRRFQFSLLGLFGLMTCVALGCAALVQASAMWCSAVGFCVVVVLLTAILGIALRPWPARAFWIGFTVFGWGYILVTFGSLVSFRSPIFSGAVVSDNVNSILDPPLSWLFDTMHGTQGTGYTPLPVTPGLMPSTPGSPPGYVAVDGSTPATTPTPQPLPPAPVTINPPSLIWDPYAPPPPVLIDPFALAYFKTTGNLLVAVLLALVGGIVARAFYATGRRADATPAIGSPIAK